MIHECVTCWLYYLIFKYFGSWYNFHRQGRSISSIFRVEATLKVDVTGSEKRCYHLPNYTASHSRKLILTADFAYIRKLLGSSLGSGRVL